MTSVPKVLLVDDEHEFLEIMSRFLNRRQLDFTIAGHCMEALDKLARERFDVVVMDISMPGLDGLACMAEMKKLYPGLEVIILTGHAAPTASLRGMKQGAFDYCLKPVDFEELLEKIKLARIAIAERHA